jgi:DNA-binding transcriptional MocR family regulator
MVHPRDQLLDRHGLVARRRKRLMQCKRAIGKGDSQVKIPRAKNPDHSSLPALRAPPPEKGSPLELSRRVQNIKPSPTLAVAAKAAKMKAEGKDIIGLGVGEPDFDTPQHIKDAAIAAIHAGFTKYTAVGGTPSLKKAVIGKFQRENGLGYAPNQILVSCGGKQSFYNLAQAFINPGDEVIIPAPYWVSYPDMVILADGVPVIVHAGIDQGFKITPAQLEAAITPKTRMLVINSPSNPSGAVYSKEELAALGEVLRRIRKCSSPATTCTSTSSWRTASTATSSTPARTSTTAPWSSTASPRPTP